MKSLKKLTALLLAASLVFSLVLLSGCSDSGESSKNSPAPSSTTQSSGDNGKDSGKTYTLGISTPQPAESAGGKVLQAACDEMTEKSNGRLKFDIYFSGQLVPVFNSLESVQNGTVDIAFFPTSTHADYLPINGNLLILPFIGYPGDDTIDDVYTQLCEEFPEIVSEVTDKGVTPLSTFFFGREDLYFTNGKSVETTSDFAGLKVAISNAPVGSIVNDFGGAPVTTTQGDIYTNLSGGVTESVIHHTSFLLAGGCVDLIKSATMFGSTGLVREMGMYVINTQVLDGIPSDLQDILKEGFAGVGKGTVAADNNIYNMVMGKLKEAGCEFTELTDEQVEPFMEAAKEVQSEAIARVAATGVDAQAIFDRAQELSAQH
ncbi:MAG: TRAP transporter substrate-binding protein [Oscillospiraceae bacterium]